MKKLIIIAILIITASTASAVELTWQDVYITIRQYESKDGKEMYAKDGKHWGWLHIGVGVMRDYNKRNPKNKVRYEDLWNEQKCFDVMKDHMIHYGKAYKKNHRVEPDMRFYYSLWGKGYGYTVRKGKYNKYSKKLMKLLNDRLRAKRMIQESQARLYKELKKQRSEK